MVPSFLRRPALGLAFLLVACLAGAQGTDRFDRRITSELRQRDAAAAALFEQANAARTRGDHQAAAVLYEQVHAAQPSFTHATRRLAFELRDLNRLAEAQHLAREAVRLEPSALNKAALALVLVSAQPLVDAAKTEAVALCREAMLSRGDDEGPPQSCAQVAMTTSEYDILIASVERLERLAPGEMSTAYLAALAHAVQGERLRAEVDLWRAHRRGLPDQVYVPLRAAFRESWPWWLTVSLWTVVGIFLWLLVAGVLLVAGSFLSRATLEEAQRAPSADAAGAGAQGGSRLRRIYAALLGFAGATYYLSLPLLLVVVLLLGGGIVLAMLAVGHIPVKLLLIVVVAVVMTCISIFKSLLVLGKDEEPGLRADLAQHPRLERVLTEVASAIGTRPVDSVYLLPGTQFAVMERGGLRRRLRGGTERCLLLGIGVLDGFRLRPFKSVLAHEYGHFVNRDTAGGGFSLSVRRSMLTMAHNLAAAGAGRFNPAWWFLSVFSRLFERISQGASRLQEVMADRWAVTAYGARAFCDGLRHVIERSARFELEVQAKVGELAERQARVHNLYSYQPAERPAEADVAKAVEESLARQPSAYDSHPSPQQRFEWASMIGGPGHAASDDEGDAWTLFTSRTAIEVALTARALPEAFVESEGVGA